MHKKRKQTCCCCGCSASLRTLYLLQLNADGEQKTLLVKSFVSNSANKNQVQGHFHPDAAGGGSARWELDSVAGARRGGRTGEMNSSDSSAFRALRVAVTPDNKGKYSEQGIALINIQCFFLVIYFFLVVAASSRAVNP